MNRENGINHEVAVCLGYIDFQLNTWLICLTVDDCKAYSNGKRCREMDEITPAIVNTYLHGGRRELRTELAEREY
jgi:hypothetical protein